MGSSLSLKSSKGTSIFLSNSFSSKNCLLLIQFNIVFESMSLNREGLSDSNYGECQPISQPVKEYE